MEGGILPSPNPIIVPTPSTVTGLVTLCQGRDLHLPAHPTMANLTRLIATYNAELLRGGDYNVKALLKHSLQRAGGVDLLRCLRRDLAAMRRAAVQDDAAPPAAQDAPGPDRTPLPNPRPEAHLPSPSASSGAPNSPECTTASLVLARDRFEFEKEKHRDHVDLARPRLDFEERQLVVACAASPVRAQSPSSDRTIPPLCSVSTLVPCFSSPSTQGHHPTSPSIGAPPPLSSYAPILPPGGTFPTTLEYPLAVPTAAIQPGISGALTEVLQAVVSSGHPDPSSSGIFSGLAAIDAAVAVTPSGSPLRGWLNSLKQTHNVYARMLAWTTDALATEQHALMLPSTYVHGKHPVSIKSKQWGVLESALAKVDVRPSAARKPELPFEGATYYSLRVALQRRNKSRRRAVASDKLHLPIFEPRADAARAFWRKTYHL